MYGSPVGSVLVTADGASITVDKQKGEGVRVFNVHIISGAGGGAVVSFKNGGASDTIWLKETGTASTGKTFDYGVNGVFFTNGCYVDVDTNTTSVLVNCRKELA